MVCLINYYNGTVFFCLLYYCICFFICICCPYRVVWVKQDYHVRILVYCSKQFTHIKRQVFFITYRHMHKPQYAAVYCIHFKCGACCHNLLPFLAEHFKHVPYCHIRTVGCKHVPIPCTNKCCILVQENIRLGVCCKESWRDFCQHLSNKPSWQPLRVFIHVIPVITIPPLSRENPCAPLYMRVNIISCHVMVSFF